MAQKDDSAQIKTKMHACMCVWRRWANVWQSSKRVKVVATSVLGSGGYSLPLAELLAGVDWAAGV